jgi:hypothetical protein
MPSPVVSGSFSTELGHRATDASLRPKHRGVPSHRPDTERAAGYPPVADHEFPLRGRDFGKQTVHGKGMTNVSPALALASIVS